MNVYLLLGGIFLLVVIFAVSARGKSGSDCDELPKLDLHTEGSESDPKDKPPKIQMEKGDEYIGLISPTNDKKDWFKKHYLYRRIMDNKVFYYITLHWDDTTPIPIPYHMENPAEEEKNPKVDDHIISFHDAEYTLEKLMLK